MSTIRPEPCIACPYRQDVPSGVWSAADYDKLPAYDAPTGEQPLHRFACHATPSHDCHGWYAVHQNQGHDRELLALRFRPPDIWPEPTSVPLWPSGAAAAAHGKRDIDNPSQAARDTVERLIRKYARLRDEQIEGQPAGRRN